MDRQRPTVAGPRRATPTASRWPDGPACQGVTGTKAFRLASSLSDGDRAARAAGLLLGYAADRLLGDPARWHPVAGFGAAANALEARLYAGTRARGAVHAAILAGA